MNRDPTAEPRPVSILGRKKGEMMELKNVELDVTPPTRGNSKYRKVYEVVFGSDKLKWHRASIENKKEYDRITNSLRSYARRKGFLITTKFKKDGGDCFLYWNYKPTEKE